VRIIMLCDSCQIIIKFSHSKLLCNRDMAAALIPVCMLVSVVHTIGSMTRFASYRKTRQTPAVTA
jgi:hypothetical protein